MFLLDTVTVSELRKGPSRAHPGVVAWNETVASEETYLSVVTLRELRTGAGRVARRDPASGIALHGWINEVEDAYHGRTLSIDAQVATVCAPLHVPDPRPAEDAWLAATASVHGLTLVTRNVSDFERMGVDTVNPWQEAPPVG